MGCPKKYTEGKQTTLEIAYICQSDNPAEATFVPFGAVTTKSLNIDGNVAEGNDSSSMSGYVENQMTASTLAMSLSGNYIRDPASYPNAASITDLFLFRANSVNQQRSEEPVVCVRYVRPDITIVAFMLVSNIGIEDPESEISTYSVEFALATQGQYVPTFAATTPPE